MHYKLKNQLLAACITLSAIVTLRAQASSSDRYLYNLDPYDIDPKSWATWRNSMGTEEWQEWCRDLNVQRWNWWRRSMAPKNWKHWKETMGPADKALWLESTKMLPEIIAREEQEEPAQQFKRKVLELKVGGTVVPKQPASSSQTSSPPSNSAK